MRQSILRFTFNSIFLLLFVQTVQAQGKEKVTQDSLRKFQWPGGVRLGTDLIAIGKNVFDSPLQSWELNADMGFGRYYLALDYGQWSRTENLNNEGKYSNEGSYWRAGVDVNFLLKDPDKNMFFIGFRYGRSVYSEYVKYEVKTVDFGTLQRDISNQEAVAGWGEMTMGLRVKIWKELWMGYTARMKFLPSISGTGELETYDIPGFGLPYKNLYWGFNYQIFYRIAFRKEKS